MRYSLLIAAILALAACQQKAQQQPTSNQAAPIVQAGPAKGVDRSHKGEPFLKATFLDEEDHQMGYKPLRGVPALVNLWATWCAPCVKELPTLEKLSKNRKADLWVVPINQDTAPRASVEAFLREHKLDLPVYRDPSMAMSSALGPDTVLPISILYDASGREVWRYVGDLDWTSPQAAKLLSEAGAAPKKG
jgi:thiol-disulfide isomerase/thioredoxin